MAQGFNWAVIICLLILTGLVSTAITTVTQGYKFYSNFMYEGCSKSIRHHFFLQKTNEAQEVCCSREMEGTFIYIRGFFPTST
jgi:hypothetical protein